MKRLMAAVAVAFTMAATFANVEMDLNMYGTPLCQYNLDTDFDTTVKLNNPIGFDTKWGFMIGAPAPFCDIGIKFDYAFDFFWNMETEFEARGKSVDVDTHILGVGVNFTLGPLVRFNLGNWHTIYVSPGLMAKFHFAFDEYDQYKYADENEKDGYGNTEHKDADMVGFAGGLAFDLDIGYRVWLINRSGFHFGLDVGVDMNWPLVVKVWDDTIGWYDSKTDGSGEYKIYFGFCFNFGDKSPDKYR